MIPPPGSVIVRQYKSDNAYRRDVERMSREGWVIQSVSTTTSRRMIGCLFGLIGYWILPKRTVWHVTFVPAPPPVAPPPPTTGATP